MKRLAVLAVLLGCDPAGQSALRAPPLEGSETAASSVVPQPKSLAIADASSSAGGRDLGTPPPVVLPPEPLSLGEPVAPELPAAAKVELAGVALEARWSWPRPSENAGDEPAPSRARVAADHAILLTSNGRMRFGFQSARLTLPAGTELLARADRYGALLVWPDRGEYRVLVPGMLRATLGDRRLDASPLSKGKATERGVGTRIGLAVRRVELTSSFGMVTLELARVREAGFGGAVLCRTLVEWAGIDPSVSLCLGEAEGELPLSASYVWGSNTKAESVRFEVTSLVVHEKDASPVYVPPAEAKPRSAGVPGPSSAVLVTEEEQGALGLGKDSVPAPKGSPLHATLSTVNWSDRTMIAVLDGSPVAYLAPNGHARLDYLRPTRHRLHWRSFFGEETSTPEDVEPPATSRYPLELIGDDEGAPRP